MSKLDLYDYTIIGAGLTGLSLASDLMQNFPEAQIQIIEKSKGCGGRMATRRTEHFKFDHGAQFIKRSDISQRWIEFWEKENILQKFSSDTIDAVCGRSGMTQLAKSLGHNLNIQYESKITELIWNESFWILKNEVQQQLKSQNVILTAPLPQSLELLNHSNLKFNSELSKLNYAKAIVVLIESTDESDLDLTYLENEGFGLFSVCSQKAKGFSAKAAWTVTMSPPWSEYIFDQPDNIILEKACEIIQNKFPHLKMEKVHLKKWRYSHPLVTWPHFFEPLQTGLYLAGDAFGGPSLLGALRSSEALMKHFISAHRSQK